VNKQEAPCIAHHIDHTAIAVSNIKDSLSMYVSLFGVVPGPIEDIPDQFVRATMIQIGATQIELIEPTDPVGAIARFIEQRGETFHHICFQVDDLKSSLETFADQGVRLIDTVPRQGLAGMIAFLHPSATRGVLIELVDRSTI
jgi:methylmalonyl-CoA/ethylmalonyl-CoA epimerase